MLENSLKRIFLMKVLQTTLFLVYQSNFCAVYQCTLYIHLYFFDAPEAPSESNFYSFSFQFLIVVVDSTDRERLPVTKAELYNMLNHEVRSLFFVQLTLFVHPRELFLEHIGPII